ncbi:MAG TPA: hypothetical protein VFJ97_02360 [Dermatophilaceae bacterium]|nr:hypothetical protein [Dermatophilaceae bacterium]
MTAASRRWVALTLLLAALCLGPAAGTSAAAAGYAGYCRDGAGVTVVVDFHQIGGAPLIRCAAIGGGTGLDALRAAGIPVEGVRRWGDAFVCRLGGLPAPTQPLPVQGRPGYREQCVDTPPATAYWSYWSASNGGGWRYNQAGVKNRQVVPGGFEGWSFALNSAGGVAPGVAPRRPVTAPRPAPTRAPSPAPAPGARKALPARSATTGRPVGPQPSKRAGTGSADTGSGRPPAPSSPAAAPLPGNATGGATTQPPGGVLAVRATRPSGIPVGTVLGAGLVAFFVTAGAGTAWARRRIR